MGMRTYRPMRLAPTSDFLLKNDLQGVNEWLRMLSTEMARIPAAPQGTPSASAGAVSLDNYLFLPGKTAGQNSRQRVTFEAKTIGAGGTTSNPTQYGVGFTAYANSLGELPSVNFAIEETQSGRTSVQNREWVFPAFNINSSGPTVGVHYLLDANDYQTVSKKFLNNDVAIALDDSVIPGGIFNAAWTKMLQVAWGGSYPAGGINFGAGALGTPVGVNPSVQIPALDYKDNGAGIRDRTHVLPIVKRAHTFAASGGAPFEPSGLLFGSSSGRELYPMFTTTQGTLAPPANASFPLWHPAITQSCTFTLSSAIVTMASTTGIVSGMRMRETTNAYALPEDTHVLSVDSPTQITMSQVWPASNLTRTIDFFGMTWSDTATSISIGAGALTNYLYLPGRATGQRIGSAVQTGNSDDIAMSGRLNIGTGAFVANNMFLVSQPITSTSTVLQSRFTPAINTSGSVTAPTYYAIFVQMTGGSLITSGSPSFIGANLSATPSFATSGVAATEATGLKMLASATFQNGGSSTISDVTGLNATARGGATYIGNNIPITNLNGIIAIAHTGNHNATNVSGIDLRMDSTNKQGGVSTSAVGLDLENFGLSSQFGSFTTNATVSTGSNLVTNVVAIANVAAGMYVTGTGIPAATFVTGVNVGASQFTMNNNATANGTSVTCAGGITTWYGIYRNSSLPANVQSSYFIYLGAPIPSVHRGSVRIGDTTTPTQLLELAAGTTTVAPLLLTSGTSLTTPVAGAIEFTTDDFFATITTGTARKAFVLDDGARLTSGRVPFATTNGRLTDNAGFLFSGASGLTLSALNLITDTTTGMKVGTATNQKLGFWNTAPIVQPTTAVGAATFVANTSGIADDSATWDGYTIGQVVKALRNEGLLA